MESESAQVKKPTTSHSPPDDDCHDPEIAIHPNSCTDSDSDSDDDHGSSASTSSPPRSKIPKPPTQPPPSQEMERYRIPPSVFERNKSSTPADWSAASNESLFSIHMGNMSFANNESWRSGELGPPTASTSDQMFCYSAHSSAGGAADMRSRELGIAEATMLEVIKENESRSQPSTPTLSEVRNTRRSAGSNQSNMSFAFSIAGGDTERIPRSASSNHQPPPQKSQPNTSPEPQPDVQTPAEKEKETKTQSRWCFCFPCCSYCL